MEPNIIPGGCHSDERGILFYNNSFNASQIKRFYLIENIDTTFIRAWQGHRVEQRWFSAIHGSFKIKLVAINNWEIPSKKVEITTYILDSEKLDILHVPNGYVSSIQALSVGSRLLVLADYGLNEISDEFRFPFDYFN